MVIFLMAGINSTLPHLFKKVAAEIQDKGGHLQYNSHMQQVVIQGKSRAQKENYCTDILKAAKILK